MGRGSWWVEALDGSRLSRGRDFYWFGALYGSKLLMCPTVYGPKLLMDPGS